MFLAVLRTTSDTQPWAQRLSFAACRQPAKVAAAASADQLQGVVHSLEQAMQPSIDIYRDALAHGPAEIQILAAYGLGMAQLDIMVHARIAIPSPPDLMTNLPAAQHYLELHHALEPLIADHAKAAADAFAQAEKLAADHESAASANIVMQNVVASARRNHQDLAGPAQSQ